MRAYIQNLQFTYGEYSMAMARCIQNNYLKAGRHSRGIKPQLLRVLYATDMPGVLTEIGFMSNPQEAAYMKSEKGQNEIARSLYQAVRDYSAYVVGTRTAEEEQVNAQAKTAAPEPEPAKTAAQKPEEKPVGKQKEKPVTEKPKTDTSKSAAEKPGAETRGATPALYGSGDGFGVAGVRLLAAVPRLQGQGETVYFRGAFPVQIRCGRIRDPRRGPAQGGRGPQGIPGGLCGELPGYANCKIKFQI